MTRTAITSQLMCAFEYAYIVYVYLKAIDYNDIIPLYLHIRKQISVPTIIISSCRIEMTAYTYVCA